MSIEAGELLDDQQLFQTKHLKRRYGKNSSMTIWRWRKQGLLPEPILINGLPHWTKAMIEEADRRLGIVKESDSVNRVGEGA